MSERSFSFMYLQLFTIHKCCYKAWVAWKSWTSIYIDYNLLQKLSQNYSKFIYLAKNPWKKCSKKWSAHQLSDLPIPLTSVTPSPVSLINRINRAPNFFCVLYGSTFFKSFTFVLKWERALLMPHTFVVCK